jgi:hypothetical protein
VNEVVNRAPEPVLVGILVTVNVSVEQSSFDSRLRNVSAGLIVVYSSAAIDVS